MLRIPFGGPALVRYILKERVLAEFGEVCGRYLKQFDLKQDVFFGSIDWDYVTLLCNKNPILYSEIPRFPEVRRDLALLEIGRASCRERV